MNGQEQGWQAKLKNAWGRLTSLQRAGIIGAGVVALALAFYSVILAQQPDYATLFSGLSDQDAADVVDQLKSLKIPYQLAQGGSAIEVPQRQVYDVRLQMAKQGLPKGSTVGFELFDSSQLGNLGMTDFMQKLDYQRALEGELARTIDNLEFLWPLPRSIWSSLMPISIPHNRTVRQRRLWSNSSPTRI